MGPIEITAVKTAEELLDALRLYRDPWKPRARDWVFRGQRWASWDITPSAWRSPAPTHAEQATFEAEQLGYFFTYADAQGLPIPGDDAAIRAFYAGGRRATEQRVASAVRRGEWPVPELRLLAALAQHYGVPTRLVDWTRKPLVAAYFAAEGAAKGTHAVPPEEAGPGGSTELAVWALRRRLDGQDLWNPDLWPATPFGFVEAPRAAVPNLHAQSGMFTMSRYGERDAAATFLPTAVNVAVASTPPPAAGGAVVLRKLTLPVAEGGRLLAFLAEEFVQGTTVYTGYEAARQSIRERAWRDPK